MQLSAFAAARVKRKLAEVEVEVEVDGRFSSRIESQEVTTRREESFKEQKIAQNTSDVLPSSTAIEVRTQCLESPQLSDAPEQLEQFEPVAKSNILSTWIPASTNYEKLGQDTFRVRLEADDTLCFVGEYCVQVLAGSLAFYGAVLEAGSEAFTVFAPSTHDLPLFECKSDHATAIFKSVYTGLRTLGRLSPLFSKIWNAKTSDERLAESLNCSSFTYLQKVSDDTLKRLIRPMHLPESWKSALHVEISSEILGYKPISLVCGAKGSEKSTFARCLLNKLYSQISRVGARQNAADDVSGIIWIDLDPSQPEFTPPGQLTAVYVRASVFGPSYTHSAYHHRNNDTYSIDQAYALGTLNCVEDADRYLCCVKQILKDFMLKYPVHPVVITLPTWAGFPGLRLMIDTVEQIQKNVLELSHVFYVGEPCPVQLQDLVADKLHHLAVPETWSFSRRSAAELRAMQTMSYFHSISGANRGSENSALKWKSIPMTDIRPWVVSYGGKNAKSGIRAILQMAETHPSGTLSTVLNGRVVSVAYLPAILPATFNSPPDSDAKADVDMDDVDDDNKNMFITSTILRTESENIPYINPEKTATLLEKYGMPYSLGYALIRAIDTQNQNFHLLTPIPANVIRQALLNISSTSSEADMNGIWGHSGAENHQVDDDDNLTSGLILALGALDTPDWAYLENGYLADHIRQNDDLEEKGEAEGDDDDGDGNDEDKVEGEKESSRTKRRKYMAVDNTNDCVDSATNASQTKFACVPWVKEVDRSRTGGAGGGIDGLSTLKRRARRI